MRKLLIILLVLALLIGAVALYLFVTTPKSARGVSFPLSDDDRALLARVPASAEVFALVPTAAALHGKLLANPVTREPVENWAAEQQQLPSPWMLGGADLVLWKSAKRTSYALRLDPLRAFLVRIYLMMSSDADAVWDGRVFVINGGGARPGGEAALAPLLQLANGLPAGDALVFQQHDARGVFPPIGRPAASTVKLTPAEIVIVSRAENDEPVTAAATTSRFPKGAMLTASFTDPPRIIGDVDRLFAGQVSDLVRNGGELAVYDVDTGTLLPRPKGIVILPATAEARKAIDDAKDAISLVGETREAGGALLVSFDRSSMPLYLKDAFETAPWPANRWAVRIDVPRFLPVAERLGDSRGLRFAASRIHRAARDLRRWMRPLSRASTIEAADSVNGGVEELRVRVISAK